MSKEGIEYNKEDKIIKIPEGTTTILSEQFQDFENLEEVIIPDTVVIIKQGAFRNCKNLKKIKLSKNLELLEAYAFENCISLEEVTIPESLHYIDTGVFKNCQNLKTINCHDEIMYINDLGLYNCTNLTNFTLPKKIQALGIKSLYGCQSIKEIHIPQNLDTIDLGALAHMSSLSKITVDDNNKKYLSIEDIAIINKKDGIFIQYAPASKKKEFTIGYYEIEYDNGVKSSHLIYNIGEYAFMDANNLETIEIPSEIESIGKKTFYNCNQLKNLVVYFTYYGKVLLIQTYGKLKEETYSPFENIFLEDGITTIGDNMSSLFKNVKSIRLPNTLEHIGNQVFTESKDLKYLHLPASLKMVAPKNFTTDITLDFEIFGSILGNEFDMLETKTSEDYFENMMQKDNIKIFSLKNGTYYVKIDDYDIVSITKEEISKISNGSSLLENDPDRFIDYIYSLLSINATYHDIFASGLTNQELVKIFDKFASDMDYVEQIAKKKNNKIIRELLKVNHIDDELLFNGIIMRKLNHQEVLNIIQNMSPSLQNFLKYHGFSDPKKVLNETVNLEKLLKNIHKITTYCNLLEKYKLYDRFLYNTKFYVNLTPEEIELILSHYNKNLKRLIQKSGVLETQDYKDCNLKDLLKLMMILGVFNDNEQLSQKVSTFITEKLFEETNSIGNKNEYQVVGNNIHRIFDTLRPKNEINKEFIIFFIENYKELIETEKKDSGFIASVYNCFEEISKCSTSNKGRQRHLKVTIDKCKTFFLMQNFNGITKENEELAKLLAKYYSEREVVDIACKILRESKNAPRNIFTSKLDEKDDLRESNENNFHYEWLPKQSWDNLILGKYCNCCAHINGAGAGIMRASMILNNCQNLAIRNKEDRIIAKMTIWVNKEEQSASFNTAEVSLEIKEDNDFQEIYEAFMRGTKAFVQKYNENNKEKTLQNVSIGRHGNVLKKYMNRDNTMEEMPNITIPDYANYSYQLGNNMVGTYSGDNSEGQIPILIKRA